MLLSHRNLRGGIRRVNRPLFHLLFVTVLTTVFAEKPVFAPYGFVKGDFYYTSGGVYSGGVMTKGRPALTAACQATGSDTSAIGFTAQHSRVGLRGSGTAGSVGVGGQMEMDFFVIAANSNARPRLRLAYAWCAPLRGFEVRIGQQWDAVGPLNPTTANTNANMWYTGNYGARRPCFEVQYSLSRAVVRPMVQASIGEAAREDESSSLIGADNLSRVPMMQVRIAAQIVQKFEVGAGGLYAAHGSDRSLTTRGMIFDASLPIHKLLGVKGELGVGSNLNNVNLSTVGGDGSDSAGDVRTVGFWGEATSMPLSFLTVVIGAGSEIVRSHVAMGAISSNTAGYGDLVFTIGGHFSVVVEYELLRTRVAGRSDPNLAHVIDIAGKVAF